MLIKKKRIRKLENYLPLTSVDNKLVFGVRDIQRFSIVAGRIGLTHALEVGETVLPTVVGAVSRFNAEGKHFIHKDRPKETVSRMVSWSRQEWRGQGETQEVTDFRDLPYKRYPRTPILAPSVELRIASNLQGQQIIATPMEVYTPENRSRLLHIINLFLEIFGECEVFHENLEAIVNVPVKRLNWKVLPQGQQPWSRVRQAVQAVVERAPRGNQGMIIDRLTTINQYKPDFLAIGQAGFAGYVVFGFSTKNLYVLESMFSNNATYVLGENWERLSQLAKAEILNDRLHKKRLVHLVGWHACVKRLLA